MLRTISIALFVFALLPAAARADLRVVTTTADLAAVTKAVGGDHVQVSALALPTQDPHFVDARPHLALDLARADLLIAVGLDLEIGWLPTLRTGSRNGKIQTGAKGYLDASTLVPVLEASTAKVDRSMGDIHPGGNPHYMYDPRRVTKVAAGIAQRLGQLDPSHATDYQQGAQRFQAQLESARKRWEQQLAGLRGKKLIAYHRSLSYLADWLGMQVVEQLEPKPGIPPNPRHIAQVLVLARDQGVKLIVQEGYYPSNTGKVIAERSGAKLVVLPGGPDFNRGQSYFAFMDKVVAQLGGAKG